MRKSINVMFGAQSTGLVPFEVGADVPPKYYTAIQSWVMCFLTTPGTRRLSPKYGTLFPSLLRGGNLSTVDDVNAAFTDAAEKCYKFCTPNSPGDVYVTQAYPSNIEVLDEGKLAIYVAFKFSDQSETFITVEV